MRLADLERFHPGRQNKMDSHGSAVQRCQRRNNNRRAPAERNGGERRASFPSDQCERLRDKIKIRQRLWLPPLVDGWYHACDRRDDWREARPRVRIRRRRKRLRFRVAWFWGTRVDHRV